MATTTSTTTRPDSTSPRTANRVAAGASALFAVTFFLTVASVNVPHHASDARLLAWWQDSGNLSTGLVSEAFATVTAILFVVMVNQVRSLAERSRSGAGPWMAFAHSMATVFCSLLLVSSALRGVLGHLVRIQGEPLPGIDVLRYSTALNYTLVGSATMTALALSMIGVSVVVLSTRILDGWVGYVGLVCGGVILLASAVAMGQFSISIALVWAMALAFALWRGSAPAA